MLPLCKILSDNGPMLEMSALVSLYGSQITLTTLLIKSNILYNLVQHSEQLLQSLGGLITNLKMETISYKRTNDALVSNLRTVCFVKVSHPKEHHSLGHLCCSSESPPIQNSRWVLFMQLCRNLKAILRFSHALTWFNYQKLTFSLHFLKQVLSTELKRQDANLFSVAK